MNDTHCPMPRGHTPFSRQFRRIAPLTRCVALLCAALLLLLSALASAPARADAPRTTLPGMGVPREVATARLVGRLPGTQILRLTFVLPLRNQADLADLQHRLYDKTDPLYQHFLKRGEFAERFGPSLAEVNLVSRYAAAHGLTLQDVTPSHTLVHVTGPAGAIETTFGVRLNNYIDEAGHPFYAPDAAPTMTSDIAGHIVGVLGLDTATVPRHQPLHEVTPEEMQTSPPMGGANVSSSNSAGLTPDDIHRVYNIPTGTGYDGSGQTLGLYELNTYTQSDVPAYQNLFNLPATPVTPVSVDGFDTSAPTTFMDGSDEVTLDIDMMLALAPNASGILVYEGDDATAIYNQIATDDKASVISTSWYNTADDTGGGTLETAEDQAFAQMAMQGQSMFSASGDGGAYPDQTYLGGQPTLSVQDPGGQRNLTSVGGTALTDNATEQYVGETSWADLNDKGLDKNKNGEPIGYGTGGGGGIDGAWEIPDYQVGAFTTAANPQGSTTMRNVPDVSLYGDYDEGEYAVYFTSRDKNNNPLPNVYGFNGTSAASPLWAAFTALVNQQRALNGKSDIGFLNPYLYTILGENTAYATDFHDIADGSNNLFYDAVAGYDNSTGIGSFIGTSLLGDLSGTGVSLATNDNFETAIPLTATYINPASSGANNLGTTVEPGEALNTSGSGGHTVWWTWTATASAPTAIDTFGSSFDTTLGVYTGSAVSALALIAGDDDAGGGVQSRVTFNAVAGTQYWISVDGYLNAEGTVVLHVTPGQPVPVITSISPAIGPQGTIVTITGQYFTNTNNVTFNETDTIYAVNSDTQITTGVPVGATTGPIQVTTNGGSASSATFTVIPVPTITSFTPASGLVNTSVTITGTGFTYATSVQFNGVNAPDTINSDTQITTSVPSGATTGPITVTSAGGTATSSNFMVATVPVITAFSPAGGLIGTSVTITGSGFTGADNVEFHGTDAVSYTVNSDTQITATVPQGATTGQIEVVTNFGTAYSSASFTVTVLTPTITSFTPTSGISGTTVTITGTHFTAASNVVFHDTDAAYTVNSDTQITATVPVGATTGPIEVVNNGGSVFSSTNFTVTYPAPTITSFTPTAGNSGTVVTITGTHFTGAGNVQFNGTDAASYTVNSDTQITAGVPRGATTGPLQVDTSGGSALSSTNFIVYNPPTITSFTPTSGPVDTMVTITGTKFEGTNSVKFNGTATSVFFVNSDTQIVAYVPSGATTGPITVSNPIWTTTSSASFTVIPAPVITSFTPTSGPVGTTVVITGLHFTGVTPVDFPASPYPKPATFTVNSDTQITAVVPAGTGTGQISIYGPGGGAQSSGTFTTTTPPVPTITSFTPTSGQIGTVVTITGTGFTAASNVEFNGHDASYTVNSSTQITATVPAGATTGEIEVVTNGGSVFSNTNFTVTYPAPTVTSFTPASGPVGTVVTITGTNFTGAGNVQFNGKDAAYTVNSNTQITATVPAGATTGLLQVDTNGGSAFSSTDFTVTVPAPTITSFTPTSGPVGTVVTITGTRFTGASNVKFDGVDSAYTVNSDTSITAAVPTGAATGPIQVVTNGGSVSSGTSFTVTIPAPTVTSFTPTSGPAGTVVTVTGTHLNGVTAVRFHNANATAFSANAAGTQLTVTVPTGAGTGTFTVTTPGGSVKTAGTFTVTTTPAPPTVTSFTPTAGPVGTVVTVTGTNLNGVTAVRFHNANATVFSANAAGTQLTVTVPTGAGTGTFTVTTPGGSIKTTGTFTVTVPPTVTSFTPTSGPIGTVVTVTGTGLNGVTAVRFHNANATTFSANAQGTQLTVTVPTGAATGTFTITTPAGSIKTTGTFTVN